MLAKGAHDPSWVQTYLLHWPHSSDSHLLLYALDYDSPCERNAGSVVISHDKYGLSRFQAVIKFPGYFQRSTVRTDPSNSHPPSTASAPHEQRMDDLDDNQPSLSTIRASVSTFHLLAILVTTWRLIYRIKHRTLWLEDVWAAVSLVADMASLISVWVVTIPSSSKQSLEVRIAAYWVLIVAFTICLWSSRFSIVFSILRLTPPGRLLRKITVVAVWVFTAFSIALLVQKLYICSHDGSLYSLNQINCTLGSDLGVVQLTTDLISDCMLISLPIRLLREVNLPKDQRIVLLSAFSSSILISLASIAHAVFVLGPNSDVVLKLITGQLELALSLIVCNMLVIVTCLYRAFQGQKPPPDSSGRSPRTHTVIFSTVFRPNDTAMTVELEDTQVEASIYTVKTGADDRETYSMHSVVP